MNFNRALALLACISFTSCYHRPCPAECVCSLDEKGRIQNICNRAGWDSIPISSFDSNVEVLIIRGPRNHLTIGPIFFKFTHLEVLRITDSNIPSIGVQSFRGVPSLRILGKLNISSDDNMLIDSQIISHIDSQIYENFY